MVKPRPSWPNIKWLTQNHRVRWWQNQLLISSFRTKLGFYSLAWCFLLFWGHSGQFPMTLMLGQPQPRRGDDWRGGLEGTRTSSGWPSASLKLSSRQVLYIMVPTFLGIIDLLLIQDNWPSNSTLYHYNLPFIHPLSDHWAPAIGHALFWVLKIQLNR